MIDAAELSADSIVADEAIGASHLWRICGNGVRANADVSLSVARGEIHGLIGENGAGKSTLLGALYGLFAVDAGQIRQGGVALEGATLSVAGSIARGVGLVHQHFMLVPSMTVVENVVLGQEPRRFGLVDLARATRELAALAEKFGLELTPSAPVRTLGVGARQRVEIAKVLWRGAKVLLLDEPTAVLAPAEVERLFAVLRTLVQEGRTVVLTSHKLDEIVSLCSRVTVLRQGRVVARRQLTRATDVTELSALVLGQESASATPRAGATTPTSGEPLLSCRDLGYGSALTDVTLEVAAGEILGVAGIEGNGQSELVELLAGLLRPDRGTIAFAGQDVTRKSAAQRRADGLRLCPEDRLAGGLVPDFDAALNLLLGRTAGYRSGPLGVQIDFKRLRADTDTVVRDFDVRRPSPAAPMTALSGGNQQKILVGRELSDRPAIFLCAQPTRGVDVGAAALLHRALVARADAGGAVLLVSADLDELMLLSNRVAVFHRGRVVGVVALGAQVASAEGRRTLRDQIGRLMLGLTA